MLILFRKHRRNVTCKVGFGKLLRIERLVVAFFVALFSIPLCPETIFMYFIQLALLAKEDHENDQYSMYLALSIEMC